MSLVFEVIIVYNIRLFSDKIKNLRVLNRLSQSEAAERALIDKKTLSRIENGSVIPKIETLERLSNIYKADLLELFVESRFENYEMLNLIKNNIEFNINNRLFSALLVEKKKLEKFFKDTEYGFLRVKVSQLMCFIDTILFIEKK